MMNFDFSNTTEWIKSRVRAPIRVVLSAPGTTGGARHSVRTAERQVAGLRAELVQLEQPRRVMSAPGLRQELQNRLTEWRTLLRAHAPQARQILREWMSDRIAFAPDLRARRYTFRLPGTLSRFFNGLGYPQGVASPTGLCQIPSPDCWS